MSKRKRQDSFGDDSERIINEPSLKNDVKEKVEVCKTKEPHTEQKLKDDDERIINEPSLKNDVKEKVEICKTKEPDTEQKLKNDIEKPEKSVSDDTKNEPVTRRKRKRSDDAEEESSAKQIKTDVKGNLEKKPIAKKVFKKRFSRNECVCSPDGSQPLQVQAQEQDAHIQVEEWRLHKFQSPIQLNHDESIHHDHFEPLEFHGHWDDEGEATFTNNGFTATLRFYDRELPILKGGPLHDDQYVFEQLHFHWSEDDHSGCEHIFEGRAYSMEAHAVHYNQKYSDFICAQNKPDGLAVVAFFIQATDNEDNPCFNKLSTAVKDMIKINSRTNVAPDCLTWFKDEAHCKGYYTYQGSLTTKPYTESVTWILYPQPIHVSRQQVANFRNLKSTPCEQHNITKNVRPIQTPPEHKKLNVFYARSHRHSTSD
ncbi:carbonic anhydrase 2 isoform X2 [Anoplophora glabripennis]|uniref:carbonic anhydrase 2 isoform X2 n=1 Tax=Anoplophora glabripennis TaxID=217634 RepID=UPI0008759351|nr:carbonic anhydrase 2 isoform X2 [Anoplophora glabripennis]